jgi:hypothetical protein
MSPLISSAGKQLYMLGWDMIGIEQHSVHFETRLSFRTDYAFKIQGKNSSKITGTARHVVFGASCRNGE